MKKYIYINILFSYLLCGEFIFAPIIYSNYESSGGTWVPDSKQVGVAGWGLTIYGSVDNFNISMDAYNNRFFGITDKPNYFLTNRDYHGLGTTLKVTNLILMLQI